VEGEYLVNAKIVDKAAREVLGDESDSGEKVTGNRAWPKVAFAVFVFLFCAGGIFYYLNNMSSVLQLANFQSSETADIGKLAVVEPTMEPVVEKPQAVKAEESESITIIPLEIVE
jgi:hypothetical protein